MALSPLAGKPAPKAMLIDPAQLEREYFERSPDLSDPNQLVSFGTSGHRGTPLHGTFTEAHILAITQAICDYRRGQGIDRSALHGQRHACHVRPGPAYGAGGSGGQRRRDGHPARRRRDPHARYLAGHPRLQPRPQRPACRRHRHHAVAQSPRGWRLQVQPAQRRSRRYRRHQVDRDRANELLKKGNAGVKRMPLAMALKADNTHEEDFILPYVKDLRNVIDMEAIRAAGLKLGVDPLGGAALHYWDPINEIYGLNIDVVNPKIDPTFSFMTVDHDGKIRMDCSSPYAMARLVKHQGPVSRRVRQRPRLRPARHRHTFGRADEPQPLPGRGDRLPARRIAPTGRRRSAVGKTLVSSSMIDRVVESSAARCARCRWASSGSRRACSTARSASAARRARGRASCGATAPSGRPTRTARSWTCWRPRSPRATGKDPGEHFQELTEEFGTPLLHANRCTGDARAEGTAGKAVARGCQGIQAGRRADHRQADPRPGQ